MDPPFTSRDSHAPCQHEQTKDNAPNVQPDRNLPPPTSPKPVYLQVPHSSCPPPDLQIDAHQELEQPSQLDTNSALEPSLRQRQPNSGYSFSNASVLRIPETVHTAAPASSNTSSLMPPNNPEKSESIQTSSTLVSFFRPKHHRRRSSSVFGWDSDDDEELNQANKQPIVSKEASHSSSSSSSHTANTQSNAHLVSTTEKSPWLQREHGKQKQVRTCLCLGVILCFLILGTILVFSFREQLFHRTGAPPGSHVKNGPTFGGGDGNNGGIGGGIQSPESIEAIYHVNKTINLDPSLKKVFYGIDYTPRGSQEPDCRVNLGQVIEDIKILSQLTTRIRLYGMACRQTVDVLRAIEYLGLPEMQVILTLWVDHNPVSWQKQSRLFWSLIDNDLETISNNEGQGAAAGKPTTISPATSRIIGISVGNEVLFRNEGKARSEEFVPLGVLTGYMSEIRRGLDERAATAALSSDAAVVSLGRYLGEIPIFSSDLGRNAFQIVDQADWIMSNIHPFFAYTPVQEAATWAFANYKTETLPAASGKPAVISEVGWPSGPSSAKMGTAVPSIENLQIFLDSWVCQANKRKVPYYYFEAFDEPWKSSINVRESQWGIMTVDRRLKVNIPTC
ncbi:hypothetical protein BGZ67_006208 [Mortierella alpina]|nr:hypothetical protein BGZ67_006208 [Mortierella alpina]